MKTGAAGAGQETVGADRTDPPRLFGTERVADGGNKACSGARGRHDRRHHKIVSHREPEQRPRAVAGCWSRSNCPRDANSCFAELQLRWRNDPVTSNFSTTGLTEKTSFEMSSRNRASTRGGWRSSVGSRPSWLAAKPGRLGIVRVIAKRAWIVAGAGADRYEPQACDPRGLTRGRTRARGLRVHRRRVLFARPCAGAGGVEGRAQTGFGFDGWPVRGRSRCEWGIMAQCGSA
jgi:hypothetical protein